MTIRPFKFLCSSLVMAYALPMIYQPISMLKSYQDPRNRPSIPKSCQKYNNKTTVSVYTLQQTSIAQIKESKHKAETRDIALIHSEPNARRLPR
ncbi:hypothetical protein BZA70DRAFT_196158 [Myxozyma melibiosi]|uniref:Secreted protein n=1 Tax=Myxozyma melibiosi TaxID=54550 RepID=A0ABR1F419_9ASCO